MNRILLYSVLLVAVSVSVTTTSAYSQSTIVPMGGHYPKAPTTTTVMSVSPNPFKARTTISYKLKTAGHLKVIVLDVKGNEVAVLVNAQTAAGPHDLEIHGDIFVASGTYYCKLTWENEPPVTVNLSVQK